MARREITWVAAGTLAATSLVTVGFAVAQPAAPAPAKAARAPSATPSAAASAAPSASASASANAAPAPPHPPKPDPATVLPPRPPTLPDEPPHPAPWERHLSFGPDLAFVTAPGSHDEHGHTTGVHYASTFGFAAHATWAMLRHLQFEFYFFDSNQGLRFDPGALLLPGQITSADSVHSYSFGVHFQPIIHFSDRVRGWLSGGIGWARWDFPRMEVEVPDGAMRCGANTYVVSNCYMLYERSNNMAVFPVGLGAEFELLPNHLSLVIEFHAAIPAFESGTAISTTRAVNADGANVKVGGLPAVDVMLVETLGLSIIL